MRDHLSNQQISEWLLGERHVGADRHLSGCALCRSEIARMERAIGGFRRTVQEWSDSNGNSNANRFRQRTKTSYWVAGWPWAAATALFFGMFAAHRLTIPHPVETTGADHAIADAALLQEVNQQLSQKVASPMRPLWTVTSFQASAR